MDFKKEIEKILKNHLKETFQLIATPKPEFGDYSLPCFKLSKTAEQLAKEIKPNKYVLKIQPLGQYLNFFINKKELTKQTLVEICRKKKNYCKINKKVGQLVIDFSSPNIAKPFGIGHLRSTIIGNVLYKIYSHRGYKCTGINHLGDWGTQFGQLITAYKKWGNQKLLKKDPINHLLNLYVKFNSVKTEALEAEARAWFKKLEEGDKESLKIWNIFRKLSVNEFKKIYTILNIKFDYYQGESFYNKQINNIIKSIQEKIKTEINEGALIIPLEGDIPPLMLRKSDGATTYAARDLTAVFYRIKQYKPQKILYVVGSEQKLHFQQLFKTLNLLKVKPEFKHVDFGLYRFPEGKMSTRKGNIIFMEDVLDRSINLAKDIIKKKNPKLKNKEKIAKQVGIGAIIFGDLHKDRIRDIIFDWNQILDFEGETAPYIQYANVRACSILRKTKKISFNVDFSLLNTDPELRLIEHLSKFEQTLDEVLKDNKPHILANYLLVTAQLFNEFYQYSPILSEKKEIKEARLLLTEATHQILELGLNLMGIKAPNRM